MKIYKISNFASFKKLLLFTIFLLGISAILINSFAVPGQAGGDKEIPLPGDRVIHSNLAVADFDGDGKKEIVAASISGELYFIDGQTQSLIWTKQLADYISGFSVTRVESSITIVDVDQNGSLELIISTGGEPVNSKAGAIIILTYTGGSPPFAMMPGWPKIAEDNYLVDGVPDGYESTPAVGDLDGDGDLEIVVASHDRHIYGWNYDGSTISSGWPIDRKQGVWRGGKSSPALADIDKDGLPEVIIGSNDYLIPACPNPYNLHVINGDGSFVPGFPVQVAQNIESSPAIGDIDGDGWLDIVVGTGTYSESCGQAADGLKVHAWDHTGKPLTGWPITTADNMTGSPSLGDINGDGSLEVVIGCGTFFGGSACNTIYAWNGDGSNVTGFPAAAGNVTFPYTPILADYDGDNTVEIIATPYNGTIIYIIEPDGTISADIRHTAPGELLKSSVVVDDIDNDGLLEMVAAGSKVYIWEETGSIASKRPWPMFHQNLYRTGLVPTTYSISGQVINETGTPLDGVTVFNSGLSTTTSGGGNYSFSGLLAGTYTISAGKQTNYYFSPEKYIVTVPPNITNQKFTRIPYNIAGKVTHANGVTPYAGVTVALSSGQNMASGADGSYTFNPVTEGTYSINPSLAGFVMFPTSSVTVTIPPQPQNQNFIVLPPTVPAILSSASATSLTYTDTQNLPTHFDFSSGTVSNVYGLMLTPTVTTPPSGFAFTGHAFELGIYQLGVLEPDLTFNIPVTVTINYSNDDTQKIYNEGELTLWRWTNDSWQNINTAATCSTISTQAVDQNNNIFTASICKSGLYSLYGPTKQIYLPVILR